MPRGKQTCKILKEIRKQIAAENDIELVIGECTYQGDCLGTCPKCEAEVRYLERELEKRQRLGKAVAIAGLSVGMLGALPEAMAQQPDTTMVMKTTDTIENVQDEPLMGIVESIAAFPGGERKLLQYIANNLEYPQEAIDAGIGGKVFVRFFIEPDGSVSDVEVLRGIGYGCDEATVKLFKSMPKWEPAKRRGEPYRMEFSMPVNFDFSDVKTDK